MKKLSLLLSAASVFAATATPASAATLLYSFAPSTSAASSFSFNIDSNPVPSIVGAFDFTAGVQNLIVGGVARTGVRTVTFNSDAGGGGLLNGLFGDYLGPQLYTGTTTRPVFLTGSFRLTDGPGGATGTLSVSTVAAVIPEPGTWAMMTLGLGLAGAAMRRRKVAARVSYAA